MKKKYIILLISLILISFVLVGCGANLRIKSNNTAILKLKIPNDELSEDIVSDAQMVSHINDFFGTGDKIDIELKYFKSNKRGSNVKVQISPSKDIEATYVDGFAIGSAYKVLKEFTLDNYGKAKWRHSKDKIEYDMENGNLFAMNSDGEKLSYIEVEKIMNKTGLRIRKAVFIKEGFYKTNVAFPGKIIIAFSKSTDMKSDTKRSVILGSEEALVIYKNNLYITLILIVLFFILFIVLYYMLRKNKKSKVSEESPQEALGTEFCNSCGAKLNENDKFCRKCGTPK